MREVDMAGCGTIQKNRKHFPQQLARKKSEYKQPVPAVLYTWSRSHSMDRLVTDIFSLECSPSRSEQMYCGKKG